MGRIFTVQFQFNQQPYTALVCLRKEGYDLSFLVRYLNKEVTEILGESKLVFSLSNGVESPARRFNDLEKEFIWNTSEAISCYVREAP